MDGLSRYTSFLSAHKPQLILSSVPEHFWPILCKKLTDQIFDSGSVFSLLRIDYDGEDKRPFDPVWGVCCIRDIHASDPSQIYLIDHAWTFKPETIKRTLRNVPGLLERMCALMQVSGTGINERIEAISKEIWRYAQTYAIGGSDFSVEDRVPLWYIMDELGSGIQHSDTPNFRTVPFIYIPEQVTYTLLFPIENVEEEDMVTRNFVEGDYVDHRQREAMLIPWKPYEYFYDGFEQTEPDQNYFLAGHIVETLPKLDRIPTRIEKPKLKVYSEYTYINQYLTSPLFEITDIPEDADIIWYLDHFKQYEELSEMNSFKFVNQLPFEYVITIKDLLAVTARRAAIKQTDAKDSLQTHPTWLPTTFNLKTELPNLVSYYMLRKQAGLNNHWICKPFNLARGLDSYITDDLNFLCRLPLTGPKVAQKYIEDPVLFDRPDIGKVKFDIRYVILLKSVDPTQVFIYRNFFLRFSNKQFSLDNFDDYEQHFTVMNYNNTASLYKVLCKDFIEEWSKQYPDYNWDDIESRIFKMFSELFTAATCKPPPCGIGKSPQSRALYAADLMLSWQEENGNPIVQPKLLEINWMPDCQRACEYYPDFYNDIFSVLFLDKHINTCNKIL